MALQGRYFNNFAEFFAAEEAFGSSEHGLYVKEGIIPLAQDLEAGQTGNKRYTYVRYTDLFELMKRNPTRRNFYVVIPMHTPVDLVFDVDADLKMNPHLVGLSDEKISGCFAKLFDTFLKTQLSFVPGFQIMALTARDDARQKLSLHFHVRLNEGFCFADIGHMNRFAWAFIRYVWDMAAQGDNYATVFIVMKEEAHSPPFQACAIDYNVYKKNNCFRLPKNRKFSPDNDRKPLELVLPEGQGYKKRLMPVLLPTGQVDLVALMIYGSILRNYNYAELKLIQYDIITELPYLRANVKDNKFSLEYSRPNLPWTGPRKSKKRQIDDDDDLPMAQSNISEEEVKNTQIFLNEMRFAMQTIPTGVDRFLPGSKRLA